MTNDTVPQDSEVPPPPRDPSSHEPGARVRHASRRGESPFGIASCIIAISVVVLMLVTAVITQGTPRSPAYTAAVLFFIFALGLGTGLGIAGVRTSQRRSLAYLGLALNAFVWLMLVILAVLTAATTTVGP